MFCDIFTVIVAGYSAQKIVIAEIEQSTLSKLRDTVLVSITSMMNSGDIKDSIRSFVIQMKETADLRIIRSSHLDDDFGRKSEDEYAQNQNERDVIEKGVQNISFDGNIITAIYPYISHGNSLNKNCLGCHHVSEGTVLGAVVIRVSLADSISRIRKYQYLFRFYPPKKGGNDVI